MYSHIINFIIHKFIGKFIVLVSSMPNIFILSGGIINMTNKKLIAKAEKSEFAPIAPCPPIKPWSPPYLEVQHNPSMELAGKVRANFESGPNFGPS
ncbi:hypothetical protein DR79_993 [Francisella tularensis]|uniref:Uncharacterized protein n=5 Tax=Francisella tularensis TaxID=263 RepID=A0AAI8BH41_FRATH|nr:hypothetical protein DA46_2018 [Francisella tularensis subsp. holarctica]AJI59630.1 hypothetical protein AW21_1684 [Francisella tularensis subsp. holarctica LVS]AJI63199.1 hypothetical protein CH65_1480 [Francisella tularensis subsp. tularensis]AJI70146.1 hypothetical protein BZ14_1660 [Francisella tularensis subsp. tularensis SCHU S4]AKZ20179.1 hypothetical protein FTZ_1118 [Francisella tularensis subsp. tularensis MA00-2987]AWH56850.1 hypothetical protein FTV_1723 [Francisella tularensis 